MRYPILISEEQAYKNHEWHKECYTFNWMLDSDIQTMRDPAPHMFRDLLYMWGAHSILQYESDVAPFYSQYVYFHYYCT